MSVDELEDERATSDDTIASGEKVLLNDGLQDRRLSRGLGSDDDDLRQVDLVASDGVEDILKLVDKRNKVVHGGLK